MRAVAVRFAAATLPFVAFLSTTTDTPQAAQSPRTATHARASGRLLIRHAMVVYGNGKPAYGPVDILVEGGRIARIAPRIETAADDLIDATGKYVLPGLVNTHAHLQDERGGVPQPLQYELNLYLAAGVTTLRDVGSDFEKARRWRAASTSGELVAPRILLYTNLWRSRGMTPAQLREGVQFAKAQGSDGLKLSGLDRDQLEAVLDEARRAGLPTATHIGVEETTAADYAELGVTSIEHFYGVADAALDGIQDFPGDMNYSDEVQRFSHAGQLYTQANLNREKLSQVLDLMVAKNVAWSPTLSIYVASRDLVRAQNVPWMRDYLHPALEDFFRPSALSHGSYFVGWTNTQEVRWRRNYRVWMDTLREFGSRGGLITTGDDAGFIYQIYGFGFVQELELHEEAGFHPLEVIAHATVNGAKLLGLQDRTGRVREGFDADLIVVNGNPLENLHLLNPYGTDVNVGNRNMKGGGIEWTIRQGVPYHVPTLLREVREMVSHARAERGRQTASQ
jgi:imidazolonepropionase-like amidohydrolase